MCGITFQVEWHLPRYSEKSVTIRLRLKNGRLKLEDKMVIFKTELFKSYYYMSGYSPDGETPGCLLCPTGSWAITDGATSIEQCTGENKSGFFNSSEVCSLN